MQENIIIVHSSNITLNAVDCFPKLQGYMGDALKENLRSSAGLSLEACALIIEHLDHETTLGLLTRVTKGLQSASRTVLDPRGTVITVRLGENENAGKLIMTFSCEAVGIHLTVKKSSLQTVMEALMYYPYTIRRVQFDFMCVSMPKRPMDVPAYNEAEAGAMRRVSQLTLRDWRMNDSAMGLFVSPLKRLTDLRVEIAKCLPLQVLVKNNAKTLSNLYLAACCLPPNGLGLLAECTNLQSLSLFGVTFASVPQGASSFFSPHADIVLTSTCYLPKKMASLTKLRVLEISGSYACDEHEVIKKLLLEDLILNLSHHTQHPKLVLKALSPSLKTLSVMGNVEIGSFARVGQLEKLCISVECMVNCDLNTLPVTPELEVTLVSRDIVPPAPSCGTLRNVRKMTFVNFPNGDILRYVGEVHTWQEIIVFNTESGALHELINQMSLRPWSHAWLIEDASMIFTRVDTKPEKHEAKNA